MGEFNAHVPANPAGVVSLGNQSNAQLVTVMTWAEE